MNNLGEKIFVWNRNLHRDVGYLCVALVLIYAISGIAVNHIEDWNPSYSIERYEKVIRVDGVKQDEQFHQYLAEQLNLSGKFRSEIAESETETTYFYQDARVVWNKQSQIAQVEETRKRPGLFFANFLHLNKAKKAWTYVADIFGVLLAYLALSGLFMVKGGNSFSKRGWVLSLLGLLIPLGFYFVYS